MQAYFTDLTVFFVVLHFSGVERIWSLLASHVVVEPLARFWIVERVSNEFLFTTAGGGAPAAVKGGRAVPWEGRTFDCTKGYQGEDVLS